MFKKSALALGLLATSSFAVADVTVQIPSGVQVLVQNGQESDYSMLGFDSQDAVVLPNGESQLVFRLSHIVRESGSKKTKYKSLPMIATFTASDADLELKVKRIDTLDEGRMFDKNPEFDLLNSGKAISVRKDKLSIGFDLMPDFEEEVAKYNRSGQSASWTGTSAAAAYTVVTATDKPKAEQPEQKLAQTTNSVESAIQSEQMLKYWFNQADAESQKAFLSWAIQNVK